MGKYIFWILMIVLCVTFFTRKDVRSVDEIIPEVLRQPVQKQIFLRDRIKFTKDHYQYELNPLYTYDISAIVTGKINYKMFTIYKYDSVFPVDLCLLWGNNVKRRIHQNRSLRFSQDCRECMVEWSGDITFNMSEFANVHLLVNDEALERKISGIAPGDQIRIKGKLVDVEVVLMDGEIAPITWKTSATRFDEGWGACEVIYVEEIETLKKGNELSHILFRISAYGLGVLMLWGVGRMFFGPV